jgi:PAS domain S-box-containing protein
MIGWSEKELLESQYPFKYWPGQMFDSLPESIQILIRDNNASKGAEMPFVRKDGEKFWGLVTSAELKDSDGHTIGYLMSVADISAQKRAENSMRDLSSRLVNAQESERKFVSQELHDGVGGKLTAIKYSLEKLISELDPDSSSFRSSLIDVLAIVHDTIGETQRIYRNLHPSILDDLGLHAALRSLCRKFREIYKDIKVECHFNLSEQRIPECLKILIFRILQEALNNVAKHSQADNVYVALDQKADTVGLRVQDDGMGFDKNTILTENIQTRGLGLRSIEGRTAIFGGSLEIQSEPGKGTVIRASWPL